MSRTVRNGENVKKEAVWNTALYFRVSREDGDKEESDSIANQRDMLTAFIAKDKRFQLYDEYTDDGYTGTNFNRPDFKRMISDMKSKRINCIIVKDLSRFGRDYIGVGQYQENVFPLYGLRFISVNDGIDTLNQKDSMDSIIVPFKNIINEQYARDISRKVRSALDTKREKGEFIGAFACYGYKKDPSDRHSLVIDEEAAEVVRKIFQWFISGTAKLTVANRLNDEGIPCPSEYKKRNGEKYINANRLERTYYWTHTTVHRILKNEMYIGNMVQHTQTVMSFKHKKNVQLDKKDWIIVHNTHEAIIDRETWDTAQRLLGADIKKSQYTGEIHLFAGIIKCADCGRAMKKRTCGKNVYYICGSYMMYGKKICSSHSIRYDLLYDMVFTEIKAQIKKYADFEKIHLELTNEQRIEQAVKKYKERRDELQKKFLSVTALKRGLYEDLKKGILEESEYFSYKKEYDSQIAQIEKMISKMEERRKENEKGEEEKRSFELLSRYRNAVTLSRELLVSLVRTIYIYENHNIEIDFNFKVL